MVARRVIVSILTWNQRQLIEDCLNSIFETCRHPDYRICVFEQNCQDGTREYLDGLGDRIDVIHSPENLGFLLGNNQVIHRYPDCDVLLLNDDTVVSPGWLETLTETAYSNPDIGIVGSKLVYPNGVLQEAGSIIYQDASGTNVGKFDDPTRPLYNTQRDVDYCSGASLYIRRDALAAAGGQLDERFAPAYYEDTDLCFSVRAAGFRVVFEPRSVVFHREGASSGVDLAKGAKQWQAVNRERFLAKWGEVLRTSHRRGPYDVPGNGKPKVLAIGKFPVMPDVASGELRLWRALQVLGETHQIVFLAIDAMGASRYVRDMEDAGITVFQNDVDRWPSFGFGHDLPRGTPTVDLGGLLMQNDFAFVYAYFPDVGSVYLPIVRQLKPETPVVVDSVDIGFLREWREIELKGNLAVLASFDRSRRMELAAYRGADRVVVVTEKDREVLLAHAPEVEARVLTNVHPVEDAAPVRAGRSGVLFIGGYSHRPNVDAAEWLVREIMPQVWATHPETHVILCGSAPPPELYALAGERVTVTGWVPDTHPHLDRAAVSLAPLRYGAGMKGKVGEALAYGLPVVTTGIGAEGMELRDGEHALIADDAASFAAAIVRLVSDDELWARLSRRGKEHVDGLWGYPAIRNQWAAITDGLVRSESPGKPGFDLRQETWNFGEPIPGSREMALIAEESAPLAGRYSLYVNIAPTDTAIFVVIPRHLAKELVPWCEDNHVRYLVGESSDPEHLCFEALAWSCAERLLLVGSSVLPLPAVTQQLFETLAANTELLGVSTTIVPPFAGESWNDFWLRMSPAEDETMMWSPASFDGRCLGLDRSRLLAAVDVPLSELRASDPVWNGRIVRSPQLVCGTDLSRQTAPTPAAPSVSSSKRAKLAVLVPLFDADVDEAALLRAYSRAVDGFPGKVELYLAKVDLATADSQGLGQRLDVPGLKARTLPIATPQVGAAVEKLLGQTAADCLMLASPYLMPGANSLRGAVEALAHSPLRYVFSATSASGLFLWHVTDDAPFTFPPRLELIMAPAVTWRLRELRRQLRSAVLDSSAVYVLHHCQSSKTDPSRRVIGPGKHFEMSVPPWKLPPAELARVAGDLWRIAGSEGELRLAELAATVFKYGRLQSELTSVGAEIYEQMGRLPERRRWGPGIQGVPMRSHLYTLLTRAAIYPALWDRAEALGEKRMRAALRWRFPQLALQERFARAMAYLLPSLWHGFIEREDLAEPLAEAAWRVAEDCPSAAYHYARSLINRRRFAEAVPLLVTAVRQYKQAGGEELFNFSNPINATMRLAHCHLVLGNGAELEQLVSQVQRDHVRLSPEMRAVFLKMLVVHLRREARQDEVDVIEHTLRQLQPGVGDRPAVAR
jgi:GT2 family glycosyltransferase/glycosyltransferase involved in cell wall biosynthesis